MLSTLSPMDQVLAEGLHPVAGAAAARAGASGQLGEDQRLHSHRPGEDQHRLQVRFSYLYFYYYFYLLSIFQRPEPVHGERGGRVDDVQRQGQDGDRAGHAGEAD